MHKIILAFDSFKGCVNAPEITESLTRMIHQRWPVCEVRSFPIADGGEGTVEVIERCCKVSKYARKVHGPLREQVSASYIVTENKVAVIELAAANGLPLVLLEHRNPLETTTLGTGELINDAIDRGCRHFVIGLGGSATNDAGIGIMHALGVRFLDKEGKILTPVGKNLRLIEHIDKSNLRAELSDCEFVLACDVTNPFYGPDGAAYVFAPQKGANQEQVEVLDSGLRRDAECLKRELGLDISRLPGAGAAGGTGGGLFAFLNAELKSGIDIILDQIAFDEALSDADVVLTGEGKIDIQTAMGKALSGVLRRTLKVGVPIVGIGGSVEELEQLNNLGFTALFSIQPAPVSLEQAVQKTVALRNLNATVEQVLRLLDLRS